MKFSLFATHKIKYRKIIEKRLNTLNESGMFNRLFLCLYFFSNTSTANCCILSVLNVYVCNVVAMTDGDIPSYAYQNFCEMYDAYHALGGNGMITKMKHEIEELHLKKKEGNSHEKN